MLVTEGELGEVGCLDHCLVLAVDLRGNGRGSIRRRAVGVMATSLTTGGGRTGLSRSVQPAQKSRQFLGMLSGRAREHRPDLLDVGTTEAQHLTQVSLLEAGPRHLAGVDELLTPRHELRQPGIVGLCGMLGTRHRQNTMSPPGGRSAPVSVSVSVSVSKTLTGAAIPDGWSTDIPKIAKS